MVRIELSRWRGLPYVFLVPTYPDGFFWRFRDVGSALAFAARRSFEVVEVVR